MKWIVFFLSILVLSLSSLPCCSPADSVEKELCSKKHSNTEENSAGEKACSPFFNCGSCTGFPIHKDLVITIINEESDIRRFTSYQDLFKSTYQNPDFKPPKNLVM